MKLSLDAFFRFLFHQKGTYEYEEEINRAIYFLERAGFLGTVGGGSFNRDLKGEASTG